MGVGEEGLQVGEGVEIGELVFVATAQIDHCGERLTIHTEVLD